MTGPGGHGQEHPGGEQQEGADQGSGAPQKGAAIGQGVQLGEGAAIVEENQQKQPQIGAGSGAFAEVRAGKENRAAVGEAGQEKGEEILPGHMTARDVALAVAARREGGSEGLTQIEVGEQGTDSEAGDHGQKPGFFGSKTQRIGAENPDAQQAEQQQGKNQGRVEGAGEEPGAGGECRQKETRQWPQARQEDQRDPGKNGHVVTEAGPPALGVGGIIKEQRSKACV